MKDPIVDEVRSIRDEHAAQFNYDVDAIYADLKQMEATSGKPHVSFGPRRIRKGLAGAPARPTMPVK